MQIVYNGPHPEVVVDELDQEQVIVVGAPVEIPDDLAARLLEQDTWHPADKASEKVQAEIDSAAATAATVAEPTVPPVSTTDAVTGPENAPQGTPDPGLDTTTEAVS